MTSLVKKTYKELEPLIKTSLPEFVGLKGSKGPDIDKFLIKQQDEEGFNLYGLEVNKEMAGYISYWEIDEDTIAIGPMYISKQFRKRGLGKTQIELLIELAKNEGYKKIFTKTWGQNKASRKILEDLGFTLTKEKPSDRLNGDSTVSYSLSVN